MSNTISLSAQFRELNRDFQALRFLAALPAAMVMTLGLIWGMERLVRTNANLDIPSPPEYKVPNPVLDLIEPQPLQMIKPEPPKPVEVPPQRPDVDLIAEPRIGGGLEVAVFEKVDVTPNVGRFSSDVPVATLMMQPNYPTIAAARGYEGYVDVQFDVAATGATENVVIIAANPDKIFNRSAIQAVKKWKYSPVIVGGKAQRYEGMVQRLVFELAD